MSEGRGDAELLFRELSAEIRSTDDVSFKLLGFLLGLLGAGVLAFAVLELDGLVGTVIALGGAVISFGFYRWELRNLQICASAIRSASELERRLFPDLAAEGTRGLLFPQLPAPTFLGVPLGKAQAEAIIYATVIAIWVVLAGAGVVRVGLG